MANNISDNNTFLPVLETQSSFSNALNKSIEIFAFYNKENFKEVMFKGLLPIASAAGLDRIVIFNYMETDGGKHKGHVYRWNIADDKTTDLKESLETLSDNVVIEDWFSCLKNNKPVFRHYKDMNDEEKKFIGPIGVRSIFLSPVFLNEKFWGAVIFENHAKGFEYNEDCASFLRAAAYLTSTAIIRQEKARDEEQAADKLSYREKMLVTLNKASIIFLSQHIDSFEEMMTAGVTLIADVFHLDRISVWKNTEKPDGLYVSQIYRWHKQSGGTTKPMPGFIDIPYTIFMPSWEGILSHGESINSLVNSLPEAEFLKSLGIVSLFVVPVFISNSFWGFVIFEDLRLVRTFNEDSTEMMKSAAFLCANTVIMNEKTISIRENTLKLKRREIMLQALNKMAITLISHNEDKFDEVMNLGLQPVGEAAGIDRVAVYKLLDNDKKFGQIYLWQGESAPLDEELREVPLDSAVLRWMEIVNRGENINANVKDMPKDEADWLSRFGVKAIYFVPIFTHGNIWGVITMEDHTNYRVFDEECIDLLQSAAHLCADTVLHFELELETEQKNKLLSALNHVSATMLQKESGSIGKSIYEGMRFLAETLNFDRICIWKNTKIEDVVCGTLFYEWTDNENLRQSRETTVCIPFGKLMPGWEELLLQGKTILSLVNNMPEPIRQQLIPRGILSIIVVPVFINNQFWGFVGFDDCQHERIFTQNEETIVNSAAKLWAGAIVRAEMENEIQLLGIEAGKVYYDALTNIYNRRFLNENLNSIMKTLSRSNGWLSLMMIDIDFFKLYNDTYGHGEGDKCLVSVAQTIVKSVTRTSDFVARYGGEEFVVVLPNTDEKGANLLAVKILENIRACRIPHKENKVADCVTVSIGVMTGRVSHLDNPDAYIKLADEMLYKSKHNGRNRHTFKSIND